MNSPARIYLDLDRTLFNTQAFVPELTAAAEKLYGLDAARFEKDIPKFYVSSADGKLRHYDFFAQIAAHGINIQHAERELLVALHGRNYVYDDAREMLQFLGGAPCILQIISYGTQFYQLFKYRAAPELAGLPIKVVFHDKASYIAQQPREPSWLIDDKITHNLPDWCTMILLDRTAAAPFVRESPRFWRINSLQSVETLLTVGYNEPNQKRTPHEVD
jgi:hypothetical protein